MAFQWLSETRSVDHGRTPGFENETDHQSDDSFSVSIQYTDGAPLVLGQGCGTDLENCNHRDEWIAIIKAHGMTCPKFSTFS